MRETVEDLGDRLLQGEQCLRDVHETLGRVRPESTEVDEEVDHVDE